MIITDLKEMDIVLRRDGQVCWILRNETTQTLETFLPDMWGQHMLSDYRINFDYGTPGLTRREREMNRRYDIIAVSKSRSNWKSIDNMRRYEIAKRDGDEAEIKDALSHFDWIYLNEEVK